MTPPMLLADFRDPAEAARWTAIDDVVMGGQSASAMVAGDGVGSFVGEVSLERGGGFASVRRGDEPIDLSACDAIELRVRGDGHQLDPARVCSLGLLISDRQAGPFRLELLSIAGRSRRS